MPRSMAAVNSIRFLPSGASCMFAHFLLVCSAGTDRRIQPAPVPTQAKGRKNLFYWEGPARLIKTVNYMIQQSHCRIHPWLCYLCYLCSSYAQAMLNFSWNLRGASDSGHNRRYKLCHLHSSASICHAYFIGLLESLQVISWGHAVSKNQVANFWKMLTVRVKSSGRSFICTWTTALIIGSLFGINLNTIWWHFRGFQFKEPET